MLQFSHCMVNTHVVVVVVTNTVPQANWLTDALPRCIHDVMLCILLAS